MSESLRNDGRIWVPKKPGTPARRNRFRKTSATTTWSGCIRATETYRHATSHRARAKRVCDEGRGVGPEVAGVRRGVYLDFSDAIRRLGKETIRQRYGNLFDMYKKITGEDPYTVPMRIYPAVHYTMGGLWVDYNLMSNIAGLHVLGEANFSDHGANRLGASALMQVLPTGTSSFRTPWQTTLRATSLRKWEPIIRRLVKQNVRCANRCSAFCP